MAQEHDIPLKNTHLAATSRWPLRRRLSIRRRKLPIIRLGGGGGEKPRRRRMFLMRMLRGMRLRWLKLQYLSLLKKLKEYHRDLVKDFKVSGSSIEAYNQRLLMETSFAVPGLGINFSNFLSVASRSNPSRSFHIM
ncbi:F15I1.22 [Salix purpurea]|uniref:F15I1.22 n=1 Tax=Salix purpurea TaxID=77065 RepID=A0A9Q0QGI0_SALPP|nr:F15I1.22 [Salix purpurea]